MGKIEERDSTQMVQTQAGRKKVRTALVGGVVAGGVVLGGCAHAPGDAATVEGTTISASDLDSAYHGAKKVSDQVTKDQAASILIQGTIANKVAHQDGIKLTNSRREKLLNSKMLDNPKTKKFAYHLADVQLVSKKIGEKKLAKKIVHADVSLNPRYGKWDPKKSVNVLPSSGSLSKASKKSGKSQQPGQPKQPDQPNQGEQPGQ